MRSVPFAILSLMAAVLALGCDASPTQPAATPDGLSPAVIFNEQFRNISFTAISDCTGEVIDITVTFHEVDAVTEDGAGGVHVDSHFNLHFTGTGETTGAQYLGSESFRDIFNTQVGNEETFEDTFTLIGHGGAPNEVLTGLFHITVNPDGTVTTEFERPHLRCQE